MWWKLRSTEVRASAAAPRNYRRTSLRTGERSRAFIRRRELGRSRQGRAHAARVPHRPSQTGRFCDLKPQEKVLFSFDPQRAVCFPARPGAMDRDGLAPTSRRSAGRLGLGLLLAPAILWLGALIVLPHADLPCCRCARGRPAPLRGEPRAVQDVLTEPLHWHVFVRTAVMSVIATFSRCWLSFPIADHREAREGTRLIAPVHVLFDPVSG